MKKILSIFFISIILFNPILALADGIILKKGSKLYLTPKEKIHAETLIGKNFALELDKDYIRLGEVLLPKGTSFIGKLKQRKKPNLLSIPGKIVIDVNEVKINGKYYPINLKIVKINKKKVKNAIKGKSSYLNSFAAPMRYLNQKTNWKYALSHAVEPLITIPILTLCWAVTLPAGLLNATFRFGKKAELNTSDSLQVELTKDFLKEYQYD